MQWSFTLIAGSTLACDNLQIDPPRWLCPQLFQCRYDLQAARDVYRFACGTEGGNRRLLLRYIEVRTRACLFC